MKFINSVYEKLLRHPKRIVFPEGTEPRVLRAASRFGKMKLGAAVLLGQKEAIESAARTEGVDLGHVGIIDPSQAADLEVFCSHVERLKRYRNLGTAPAYDIVINPNYFGALMIQYGQADALVGGVSVFSGTLLRPLIQLVKPLPNVTSISSCIMLELPRKEFGEKGVMLFADCGVIPEPSVEQLANIAIESGKAFAQLTGTRPRIAMLSFSTKGSAKLPCTEKIAAAAALARQKAESEHIDMEVDGEMQADTALLPELAERKAPNSLVAGRANVFIFPDLNSGNIAVKLVEHLAGAQAYGQILLGLSKPCADVSRGATEEEILGVAAIVGLQAIQYRKLYPAQDWDNDSAR
jgi:phosphate acetyltransferase